MKRKRPGKSYEPQKKRRSPPASDPPFFLLPQELILHVAGFLDKAVDVVAMAFACTSFRFLLEEPGAFGLRTLTKPALRWLLKEDVLSSNCEDRTRPFRCCLCLTSRVSILRCVGMSDTCVACIRKNITGLDAKLRSTLEWYATRCVENPRAEDVINRWRDPRYTRAWVAVKLQSGSTPEWARKVIGWVGKKMPDGTLHIVYQLNNWVSMVLIGTRLTRRGRGHPLDAVLRQPPCRPF